MKYSAAVRKRFGCYIIMAVLFVVCGLNCLTAKASTSSFTQEEQDYIKTKKVLRVAVVSSWKPYSYINNKEKEGEDSYEGYAIYLLKRVCEQTGLELELHSVDNYQEAVALRKNGTVDINGVEFSSGKSSEKGTDFLTYLETSVQLIVHKNSNLLDKKSFTIASVEDVHFFNLEEQENNTATISEYANLEECMNAVRTLRADFAASDQYTFQGLDSFLLMKDLVTMNLPTKKVEVGFGISATADPMLTSILQKVIDTVTLTESSTELMRHSNYVTNENSVLSFIYQHPLELICAVIAVAVAVIISVLAYTRIRVSQHKVLQGYEEGYRMLANTFGEMGLEYDYLHDRLTLFGSRYDQLDIPEVVDDFRLQLKQGNLRIMMSEERFDQLLSAPRSDRSYDVEFQCGMRNGSQNWFRMIYIVVSTEESHRRPIRLIGCLVNVEEEHQEKEQLKTRGMNDQLTGLLNRWAAEELIEARLQDECIADTAIIIDLDFFKVLNDRYGHLCGDAALRNFGMLLQEVFGKDAILCRWGGDEFLLYWKEHFDDVEIERRFKELQKRMKAFQYNEQSIPISLSIGAAVVTKKTSWESLFSKADEALYKVKGNGRDHFFIQKD